MEALQKPLPCGRGAQAQIDEAYVKLTLDHLHGNRRRTAEPLGISLRTLENPIATLRREAKAVRP
jgi:DNA-binding NtrC family response regulator